MKNLFLKLALTAVVVLTGMLARAADVDATMTPPSAVVTVISGGTNKAMALTTNAFFTIDNPDAKEMAFYIDFKYLNAVGSGDVNRLDMEVFRGVDSGTFESNVWQTISFAANATTTINKATVTNLVFDGVPSFRLRFLNLSTNAHATNITVKVKPKYPRAPL